MKKKTKTGTKKGLSSNQGLKGKSTSGEDDDEVASARPQSSSSSSKAAPKPQDSRMAYAVLAGLLIAGGAAAYFGSGSSDAAKNDATTTAPSGAASVATPAEAGARDELGIKDIQEGGGPVAVMGDTVSVHYVGTLADGSEFDSSKKHNKPFDFKLGAGQVIKGWEQGVFGMKVGGTRKLTIPPGLGYGHRGSPPVIPADATLTFVIELLDVKKAMAPDASVADDKDAFTLAEATKSVPGTGPLYAHIKTAKGTLDCKLYDDKAPYTVANYIGLAMGTRKWKDPKGEWVKKPAFDGTGFHRIIKGFMIQGGDPKGDGSGEPGYVVKDEIWAGGKHDRAGLLCMANRGPNTNGQQFFITDAPTPQLDGKYTIFGECAPEQLIHDIANMPVNGDQAKEPVKMDKVTISRSAT